MNRIIDIAFISYLTFFYARRNKGILLDILKNTHTEVIHISPQACTLADFDNSYKISCALPLFRRYDNPRLGFIALVAINEIHHTFAPGDGHPVFTFIIGIKPYIDDLA